MTTELNHKAIAIEVKPDWTKFSIWVAQHSLRGHKKGFNYLQYFEGEHPIYDLIELPEGSWLILGKGNELTEDQWKGIVERQRGETGLFKDYQLKGSLAKYGTYTLTNSKDSGMSLLGSHNINPSEVIILIKQ